MKSRIYVYKCVNDDGGAPCIDGGRLSLTICKPKIRRPAREGDLLFAFGSNHETPANRLVYVARVTKRVPDGAYFELAEYSARGDCIYRRQRDGALVRRSNAKFHTDFDHRPKDVGSAPNYLKAVALVSDDFRYFGAAGTDDWKQMAPRLRKVVEDLRRGHRVNHSDAVEKELLALADYVKRAYGRKINGQPLHAEQQRSSCKPCVPRKRKRAARVHVC